MINEQNIEQQQYDENLCIACGYKSLEYCDDTSLMPSEYARRMICTSCGKSTEFYGEVIWTHLEQDERHDEITDDCADLIIQATKVNQLISNWCEPLEEVIGSFIGYDREDYVALDSFVNAEYFTKFFSIKNIASYYDDTKWSHGPNVHRNREDGKVAMTDFMAATFGKIRLLGVGITTEVLWNYLWFHTENYIETRCQDEDDEEIYEEYINWLKESVKPALSFIHEREFAYASNLVKNNTHMKSSWAIKHMKPFSLMQQAIECAIRGDIEMFEENRRELSNEYYERRNGGRYV